MEYVGYFASVLMGLSLGLVGGGGSILTVPILVYIFKIDPTLASAYSLFIVGSTAFVGGLSYLKKGEVDLRTGFIFAVPSFIGVYVVRAYILPNLQDPVFSIGPFLFSKALLTMLVFSIMMLLASVSMIRPRNNQSGGKALSATTKILIISLEGLVVGAVTGFVGAGGGFLIIPALVILVAMPMKKAVGTSLFIIAVKSLFGFVGDIQAQVSIDWHLLIVVTGIAIVGLFAGMALSKKISDASLKKGFGFFVLIMGALILFDQLHKL